MLLFALFYVYKNIPFYLVFVNNIINIEKIDVFRKTHFFIINTSEEENEKINKLCLRFLNMFILENVEKNLEL